MMYGGGFDDGVNMTGVNNTSSNKTINSNNDQDDIEITGVNNCIYIYIYQKRFQL